MNYVLSLAKEIIKSRRLIWDLAKSDFRKRFVGSYFGVVWMFVQPIVTVLIYFFVFQMGFKSTPPIPGYPYVLWLIPGIVPWFYMNETMNCGTQCLQEYHYLVKKVVFRVEILPLIKLISCLFVHLIFMVIMTGVFLLYGVFPHVSWVQVIYYCVAASTFSLAIVYFTSAVNVFFKDMAQIVNITLQIGMWLTTIMWDPAMFEGHPAWLDRILPLNPVWYIVNGYRDSMLTGTAFWTKPGVTVYFWAVTIALLLMGLKVFKRLRPHFSDVL